MDQSASNPSMNTKDLASLLAHVETLQRQLSSQSTELKTSREQEESARSQLKQLEDINNKLSESKREDMRAKLQEHIQGWVKSFDEKEVPAHLKEEFLSGVGKFAEKGDETGVWKVVCCASAVHQNQVNTINRLTEEYNELKSKVDRGEFRSAESRKRKEPEEGTNVWSQLEGMCKNY
jgi:small-conductance mechanosensitive channel